MLRHTEVCEGVPKMVRKLKHHEQKLLKKVDFTTYKSDNDHRAAAVARRYMIQKSVDHSLVVLCYFN